MSDIALTKDAILGANDRRPVRVECPEWGGHVYLIAMSGTARDRWEQRRYEGRQLGDGDDDWGGLRASLVAAHLCDAAGQPLEFSEGDVLALGEKSAAALDRLFDRCQKLSGISETDIEGLEKN